jgi:hypothetical protein
VSEPPPAANAGPPRALRAPGTVWQGTPPEAAACVHHIDPPHGARGVFRDGPVVVSFSRPTDASTLSPETFVVIDEHGGVPGGVWTSLDGRVAVWTPNRLLTAGALHCIRLSGVHDRQGRPLISHESVFVPGDLALGDLPAE